MTTTLKKLEPEDIAPVLVPADSYEFKAASQDWQTINFGAASGADSDREVMLCTQQPVIEAAADNLIFSAAAERTVVFVLDLNALSTPVIKAFEERFCGDVPVYIRGGINSWSAEDELTWQGDGSYATQLSLDGGATELKVASED